MATRNARPGILAPYVTRFASKADLQAGGSAVRALRYQRASQDKKKQGKSVGDQGNLNLAEIRRYDWSDVESFTDNNLSASRHAKKEREDFEHLMDAIRAGRGDVLVVWTISRNQRDLAVYVKIRDLCLEVGLHFWLVGGVLFDLRDKNDRMMLGFQAVQAEFQADSIRDEVLRGMAGAAQAGRPHGKITYGYRRIYDQRTRALLRQEPDSEPRTATGRDGTTSEYTRAGVVDTIFRRVSEGVPLITIQNDLNDVGIPSPEGTAWRRGVIRRIALNPAYIGKRVYQGQIVGDGIWPALVADDVYWECVRLLGDPSRKTTRPGRAVHLLSAIVTCGKCGAPLSKGEARRGAWRGDIYRCSARNCAAVTATVFDEYVQRAVVAWLALPDTFAALNAHAGGDEQVVAARAEASRLRAELEDWRRLARAGKVSAVSFAAVEPGLLHRITEEDAIAAEAGAPPILRGRIGAQAIAAWAELAHDVAVKREIIRTVTEIKLLPAGKGSRRPFGRWRLAWRWKFGPADDTRTLPAA
jgi:site-specific DNA recombinase